jgi:hypothetical protein
MICGSLVLVLDPRFMMALFEQNPDLFSANWLASSWTDFIAILKDQYDDQPYKTNTSSSDMLELEGDGDSDDLFHNPLLVGAAPASATTSFTPEDELRKYLKEPRYIPEKGADQSPLLWWKLHARFYPRLAHCARDVLAIPGMLIYIS